MEAARHKSPQNSMTFIPGMNKNIIRVRVVLCRSSHPRRLGMRRLRRDGKSQATVLEEILCVKGVAKIDAVLPFLAMATENRADCFISEELFFSGWNRGSRRGTRQC